MRLLGTSHADIAFAGKTLAGGGLVAFPTETVYGLGADATNRDAVSRVFSVKGRPHNHPLILHIESIDRLANWVSTVPSEATALGSVFWPGPLTLILPRGPATPLWVTGGQETVGIRVPGHPIALELIESSGTAIAAPSANRFGRVSPTCAAHVAADLGDDVDCIIDGGPCEVGLESTIVDLSGDCPRVLRPGAVSAEDIARTLGHTLDAGAASNTPRVPGNLPSHYAPKTPLLLANSAELESTARAAEAAGTSVAILSLKALSTDCRLKCAVRMPGTPKEYGRVLYARLRDADAFGCQLILVENPPPGSSWSAVRDRLSRAAKRQ